MSPPPPLRWGGRKTLSITFWFQGKWIRDRPWTKRSRAIKRNCSFEAADLVGLENHRNETIKLNLWYWELIPSHQRTKIFISVPGTAVMMEDWDCCWFSYQFYDRWKCLSSSVNFIKLICFNRKFIKFSVQIIFYVYQCDLILATKTIRRCL